MYPPCSSTSSSSQAAQSSSGGLNRYDSAPGSFLAAVDSVIGRKEVSPLAYFSNSSEPNAKSTPDHNLSMNGGSPLIRHSSLPAGFLNRVASAASADNNINNGFSVTRGMRSYNSHGGSDNASGIQRLNSQLSFTRQDSLSQITEESEDADDDTHAEGRRKAAHSFATASFGMGSWDNSSNITFSGERGKRAKNDNGGGLNIMESQFQFGLSEMALDMASMEHMMDIPQDSVPCKARAKRGCATHPRSIAERERRTRISGKLKKLQDLVPNMDKDTD